MTLYLYIIAEKFYIILQFNIVRSNHAVNAKEKRLSNRFLTKEKFLPPMESFSVGYLHTDYRTTNCTFSRLSSAPNEKPFNNR